MSVLTAFPRAFPSSPHQPANNAPRIMAGVQNATERASFDTLPVELMEHIMRDLSLTKGNRYITYDISQPDHRLIALHRLARTCPAWRAQTLPAFCEMTATSGVGACQRRMAALAEDSRTLARV